MIGICYNNTEGKNVIMNNSIEELTNDIDKEVK